MRRSFARTGPFREVGRATGSRLLRTPARPSRPNGLMELLGIDHHHVPYGDWGRPLAAARPSLTASSIRSVQLTRVRAYWRGDRRTDAVPSTAPLLNKKQPRAPPRLAESPARHRRLGLESTVPLQQEAQAGLLAPMAVQCCAPEANAPPPRRCRYREIKTPQLAPHGCGASRHCASSSTHVIAPDEIPSMEETSRFSSATRTDGLSDDCPAHSIFKHGIKIPRPAIHRPIWLLPPNEPHWALPGIMRGPVHPGRVHSSARASGSPASLAPFSPVLATATSKSASPTTRVNWRHAGYARDDDDAGTSPATL